MIEYMRSNITLMKWMIAEGYSDARTLKRRINAMEDWIANGELLKADANAQYAAVIEIDLAEVTEPILACPNDPDDVSKSGARMEMPGCSLCMAMRVATEKLAGPRVNFSPDQIDSIHHKNLDHRGPKATIQHGVLFFDRGGNKTPYVTTSSAILREMFRVKDGTQQSATEDFGGDAANRMDLLKQGVVSLMTGGDFARVGYVKYAGAKTTWMKGGGRFPGDLTLGRSGEKGKGASANRA